MAIELFSHQLSGNDKVKLMNGDGITSREGGDALEDTAVAVGSNNLDLRFVSSRLRNSIADDSVDTLQLYDREKLSDSNINNASNEFNVGHRVRKDKKDKTMQETEYSATTEASVSSESQLEDFRDNDNDSVYSDIASLSSKPSKTAEVRQYVRLLAKLKNENMLLKESLKKTNVTDIVTLKTELRGSRSDIIQLRQHNSELKDRVQILEQRLFNALSNLASTSDESDANTITIKNAAAEIERTSADKADSVSKEEIIRPWKSRCSHLSRLLKSYEQKMEQMELEIDSLREKKGLGVSDGSSSSSSAVQRLQSRVTTLEAQRESDQKVIQELTAELKRTALEKQVAASEGEDNRSEFLKDSAITVDKPAQAKVATDTPLSVPTRVVHPTSYSANQLLLSFFAGLILMMLCTLFI